MHESEHAVIIAGGGPAGMMLAAELALAQVDVVVVERRPNHVLVGSRAGGFHARTLEVLDMRGVVDRFLAEGQTAQASMLGSTILDMSDFPTRHPYSLGIWQNQIERIMSEWVAELPVPILYGREVTSFTQDGDGVSVQLTDGASLRAQYLVGCDGGRSLIRKQAGIDFPGLDATRSNIIAEAELTDEPPAGVRHDEIGVHGLNRLEDGRTFRIIVTERELGEGAEPSLRALSAALTDVFGTDFGVHSPTWISRFTDATRHAATYRQGRVLLAGDAAHIHYPAGGQGLSLGVQDAVNLGWKLALVVGGVAPDTLMDSYHEERHAVGTRALEHTIVQAALQRRDERMAPLVDLVSSFGKMDEPRRKVVGTISALDIHYDLGDGHPLLGRRMPDLNLDDGRRVFELLRDARPVLLDFGGLGGADIAGWADRVPVVAARYDGVWELPVLGVVSAPSAVLVRPDGYVAWVSEDGADGLTDALATWFGPPVVAVA